MDSHSYPTPDSWLLCFLDSYTTPPLHTCMLLLIDKTQDDSSQNNFFKISGKSRKHHPSQPTEPGGGHWLPGTRTPSSQGWGCYKVSAGDIMACLDLRHLHCGPFLHKNMFKIIFYDYIGMKTNNSNFTLFYIFIHCYYHHCLLIIFKGIKIKTFSWSP
jgi:hypothetical protein